MIRFTEYPPNYTGAQDAILHFKNFEHLKHDDLFLYNMSVLLHVVGVREDISGRARLFC